MLDDFGTAVLFFSWILFGLTLLGVATSYQEWMIVGCGAIIIGLVIKGLRKLLELFK